MDGGIIKSLKFKHITSNVYIEICIFPVLLQQLLQLQSSKQSTFTATMTIECNNNINSARTTRSNKNQAQGQN